MTTADPDDGWHYGPDGQPSRGFLEGTAFQPDELQDHMDCWGTPHPGHLSTCTECRTAASITQENP
ncbi:hypothetical protein ACFYOF_16795 [Streptomyces sp. NPDC007148]|uniref:hypothetical protein n=1 Tax=Streptomyces sp. NPDC007148 TaxID=3364775 RepID=UPI0036A85C0D